MSLAKAGHSLTRGLELVTFILSHQTDSCELQASCWQHSGFDSSGVGNIWSIHLLVAELDRHYHACEAANEVVRPQGQNT